MADDGATEPRIGVDIGGTFTDVVLLGADGRISARKLLTTPDDYGRAVVAGVRALLEEVDLPASALREVVHGTTVATNAILELQGAPTGLITTLGFRDVLEMRRIRAPALYDLFYRKPPPLVPRRHRLEVDERIDHRGAVVRPLDLEGAERALERLVVAGITSLAVCFLNSYANPAHERAVGELARRRFPDLDVSLSSDVLPEIKEYERTSTAVINAYLKPVMRRYLVALVAELDRAAVRAPLLIMQSNGGIMTADAAAERPIHIVESGPAAGVIAAAFLARRIGLDDVLTFDMGGTTAKASILERGEPSQTPDYEVGGGISITSRLVKGGGYALRAPVIDIAEVGAGGGSIVWLNRGGSLQVGPRSAGADPGPVCYGRGGTEPTVSDANVVLGYLNPASLAGGAVRLDAEAARRAVAERIAGPLGLDLHRAAYGVHLVANAAMIRAVRAVSSQRGRDPRGFALCAFGGSGPVHAVELARALDMPRVVVPRSPGLFSAFGLLVAEVEHHYVRTFFRRVAALDPDELDGVLDELTGDAAAVLASEGYPREQIVVRRSADLRYAGQAHELAIPIPDGPLDRAALDALAEAFGREHERTYGNRGGSGEVVDLVNVRVVGVGVPERPRVPTDAQLRAVERRAGVPAHPAAPPATRPAYFGDHGLLDTPILDRPDLTGDPHSGPLIVEEYDATTVVPPGCTARLDEWGNIVILVGGA